MDAATRRRILEYGAAAPSGDNLQPWLVDWSGDTLHLGIDPSCDRSLYNFQYKASHIALGAMVENVAIAASESGFATRTELSLTGDGLLSASLIFEPGDVRPDPLSPFVLQRCTNRKPYASRRIAPDVLRALAKALPEGGGAEMLFIEDAKQRRILARAASLNDRLLFEIKTLHNGFFDSIRWTEREAEESRDGLFLKTLELGPMTPTFKAMGSWSAARVMNMLGASRTAPFHSYWTFMRSAAFGFLQMSQTGPETFVSGGRALQRVWLTTTSLGLSLQPMVGMLYLLPYLRHGAERAAEIGPNQQSIIRRAEGLFKQVLPLDDRHSVILLFRLGYGPQPTATSLRRLLNSGKSAF